MSVNGLNANTGTAAQSGADNPAHARPRHRSSAVQAAAPASMGQVVGQGAWRGQSPGDDGQRPQEQLEVAAGERHPQTLGRFRGAGWPARASGSRRPRPPASGISAGWPTTCRKGRSQWRPATSERSRTEWPSEFLRAAERDSHSAAALQSSRAANPLTAPEQDWLPTKEMKPMGSSPPRAGSPDSRVKHTWVYAGASQRSTDGRGRLGRSPTRCRTTGGTGPNAVSLRAGAGWAESSKGSLAAPLAIAANAAALTGRTRPGRTRRRPGRWRRCWGRAR